MARVPLYQRRKPQGECLQKPFFFLISWCPSGFANTHSHTWLLYLLELFKWQIFFELIFSPVDTVLKAEVFYIILDNLFVTSHCRAHKSTPNPSLCRWEGAKAQRDEVNGSRSPAPVGPTEPWTPSSLVGSAGLSVSLRSAPSLSILRTRTLKETWRREWEKWMSPWENKSSEILLATAMKNYTLS